MSSFTGQGGTVFPAGTDVDAYLGPAPVWWSGGAPFGDSAGSATIGDDGAYTITGLTAGATYLVGAEITTDVWRYVMILVPPAPGQTITGDLAVSGKVGFNGKTPIAPATGAAATADTTWSANEVSMLQAAYDVLRAVGLLA